MNMCTDQNSIDYYYLYFYDVRPPPNSLDGNVSGISESLVIVTSIPYNVTWTLFFNESYDVGN